MTTGYYHALYADSFSKYGTPIYLPESKGWILKRNIPGTDLYDAMGYYPLFCCKDWDGLERDLYFLSEELVSLVLVTDPMAVFQLEKMEDLFDYVIDYKKHFVVRTGRPLQEFVTKHHQKCARRALRKLSVEVCDEPIKYLDDWVRLYSVLVERHSIHDMRAFSRDAFERQFATPGFVMFRAVFEGRTVGMDLWYVQDDVAQGHLAAFDELGYKLSASYATQWKVLEYFNQRLGWINIGGGTSSDSSDGLSYFKSGFATDVKQSWIFGKIFQPDTYRILGGSSSAEYFPDYRCGEFK